jgi:hypothetical protein
MRGVGEGLVHKFEISCIFRHFGLLQLVFRQYNICIPPSKMMAAKGLITMGRSFLRTFLLRNAPAGNHQVMAEDLVEDGTISRTCNSYSGEEEDCRQHRK